MNSVHNPRSKLPPGRSRAHLERRALLDARALVDRMRSYYQELERLTGAPISVHRALNAIGANPGLQASRLAVTLDRGWAARVRAREDQRAVRLYLTAGGTRVLKVTAGRAVGRLQRAIKALSDEDLRPLAASLPALLQRLPTRPARKSAGSES